MILIDQQLQNMQLYSEIDIFEIDKPQYENLQLDDVSWNQQHGMDNFDKKINIFEMGFLKFDT